MTIKLRYKAPDGDTSRLTTHPLVDGSTPLAETPANFRWSASVAAFGMLLREPEYMGRSFYDQVVRMAEGAKAGDSEGYRIEFYQ